MGILQWFRGRTLQKRAYALDSLVEHLKTQKTKMPTKKLGLDGTERSMISVIKNDAYLLFSGSQKSNIKALEEFSAGTGISDLTIFSIDKNILRERKQSTAQPVTSKNHIQVLLAVLDNHSTLDEITTTTRLSKATVQKILGMLIEEGLVVLSDSGSYSTSYTLPGASSENIVAIEAKVRDWKSGIRQALRYKEYADYSYLAIYEDNIASCLKNIEIFKNLGIGLIGVSDNGISIHLEATLSDVTTRENKLLAFERFVSVIDESYQSFVVRNNFTTNNAA